MSHRNREAEVNLQTKIRQLTLSQIGRICRFHLRVQLYVM